MKRPQSANHNRNYFAPASRDDGDMTEQQPHRVFVKMGKKGIFNPMTASNDLSRMLPKKIQHDKERLYCQTLQLKTNLNEVSEENLRLKTKIATLQKQKDRLNRTEEPPLTKGKSSNFSNLNSKGEKQNGIVSGLKKIVRQARQENQTLKNEIAKIKRAMRYTKLNEVEVEKQTLLEENKRLAKVIQQLEIELATRLRQDQQIRHMQAALEEKQAEIKQVTADNIKYEEILQDMEIRNKEVSERLLVSERKWQRDLSVEKRKIEQLNRQVDLLKHEVKMLTEKLEDERKKAAAPKPKISRPTSSRPYHNLDSNSLKNRNKEKEEAMQKNQKLKQEIELAKRKLVQSQNQLKITADQKDKQKLELSKDQTFELVLTKNEANEFMRHDEQEEYSANFDQSPKPSNNFNELPLQQKSKTKSAPKNKHSSKHASPIMNEIRQILTFRMKYNRYPFNELKADIESSPLSSFIYEDLINMLESEPFFLTQQYAEQFLKVCFGKDKLYSDDELDSATLLKNLRAVIDDFELLDEEEEERMLYKIAEFMTKHRGDLQNDFKKVGDRQNCINKAQLVKVLKKYGEMSQQEIILAICYISINAESLQAISYTDLLDRFYINSSRDLANNKGGHLYKAQQLSMGQNQDLDEGELIADDELV